MARGRMLNRIVADDLKLAALGDDAGPWCLLYFDRLITWIDKNGNVNVGAEWAKGHFFPNNKQVTAEDCRIFSVKITEYLSVTKYTDETGIGEFLHVHNFFRNQIGFRPETEKAEYPDCPEEIKNKDNHKDIYQRKKYGNNTKKIRKKYGKNPLEVEVEVEVEVEKGGDAPACDLSITNTENSKPKKPEPNIDPELKPDPETEKHTTAEIANHELSDADLGDPASREFSNSKERELWDQILEHLERIHGPGHVEVRQFPVSIIGVPDDQVIAGIKVWRDKGAAGGARRIAGFIRNVTEEEIKEAKAAILVGRKYRAGGKYKPYGRSRVREIRESL